jgi:hypothetical protein
MMLGKHIAILLAGLTCILLGGIDHAFAWTSPLGIPAPGWPADLDIARPAMPDPWTGEQAGWYFVSASGCSDSRTYGHPGAPRCSLPSAPSPGASIVLDGTLSGSRTISWTGTAQAPIWIMGHDPQDKPLLASYWRITGAYLIFDHLSWRYNARDSVSLEGDHLMIRDCDFANPFDTANGAAFGISGTQLVYYRNIVSQMGDWQYSGTSDIDRHGIKVSAGAADVWIVDSAFYHCHGDGVQVGDYNNTPGQVQRIYLGRNSAHENYQCGFWTKNATDVIFSQNYVYDMTTASEYSRGIGLGGQYDATQVWFIANTVRNCNVGIHIVGASAGGGGPWYAIANLLFDLEFPDGACNNYDVGALEYRNAGGFSALFNTVYNADMFVAIPHGAGGPLTVSNNIFSARNTAHNDCTALAIGPAFTHDYNLFSQAADDPGAEAHRRIEAPAATFVQPGVDFQLRSSSLAVDNADPATAAAFSAFQTRYGIDLRKDMAGTARPQGAAWDIGAHEYSDGSTDTSAPAAPSQLSVN